MKPYFFVMTVCSNGVDEIPEDGYAFTVYKSEI